jgi:hypothetical protein
MLLCSKSLFFSLCPICHSYGLRIWYQIHGSGSCFDPDPGFWPGSVFGTRIRIQQLNVSGSFPDPHFFPCWQHIPLHSIVRHLIIHNVVVLIFFLCVLGCFLIRLWLFKTHWRFKNYEHLCALRSVVVPDSDPDLAFQVNPDPDTYPGFWWTKIGKNKVENFWKIFFYHKLPLYRASKVKEKPSALKKEYPALQKMKFLNSFRFSVPDADPDPQHCLYVILSF